RLKSISLSSTTSESCWRAAQSLKPGGPSTLGQNPKHAMHSIVWVSTPGLELSRRSFESAETRSGTSLNRLHSISEVAMCSNANEPTWKPRAPAQRALRYFRRTRELRRWDVFNSKLGRRLQFPNSNGACLD